METIESRSLHRLFLLMALLLAVAFGLGRDPGLCRFILGGIDFLFLFFACILGVRTLSQELESRTAYCVLSKPISREGFLLGKYLGTSAALWLLLLAVAGLYLLLFPVKAPLALLLIGLKAMLLLALAQCLALVMSPSLAFLCSGGLALLGHQAQTLRLAGENSELPMRLFARVLYYLLPNFQVLDFLDPLASAARVSLPQLAGASLYGVLLICALLTLSMLVFKHVEL